METRPEPPVAAPPGLPPGATSDVVEEAVPLDGRTVRMLRPRDGDAVLDELLAEDDPEEERLPFWTELWPSGTALARAVTGMLSPSPRASYPRLPVLHDLDGFSLSADIPLPFQLDGEYVGDRTSVTFGCLRSALSVVAPPARA